MASRLTFGQQVLVAVWILLAVSAIYYRGIDIGIDRQVSSRLRYHAIPVAMSVLYHHRPHDYTAFFTIATNFQIPGPIEDKIAFAVNAGPPLDDKIYFWAADDRGMADYVIAAFRIFGPSVSSLYRFYFLILGLSVLLFLIDLGSFAAASAVVLLVLGAIYSCLSVIPLGNLAGANFEAGALYEPRIIELLALVATIHLALASLFERRWSLARFGVIGLQAAIVGVCYHARSSVAWEVVAIVAVATAAAAGHLRTHWHSPTSRRLLGGWLQPLWSAVMVVVVIGSVVGYQRFVFHPRYFLDMGARTVWHNALMGLGFNEHLGQKYKLAIDDRAVAEMVIAHRRARLDDAGDSWDVTTVLNSLGGHVAFDWFAYEREARALYWQIWRADAGSMLRCYVIDKPRQYVRVIAAAWTIDPTGARNHLGLYFNPFSAISLLIVAPGLLLAHAGRQMLSRAIAVALVLLVGSTIPSFLFYPVVHAMMGSFAALALVIYLTLVSAAVVLAARWQRVPA